MDLLAAAGDRARIRDGRAEHRARDRPLSPEAASWRVEVGDDATSALYEPASVPGRAVFVCAHGAGGHMTDRAMEKLAPVLRARGLDVVRFNFLYRQHGSRRPDPMPKLQACMRAVIARTREALAPRSLLIGGRSMGGRTASMLAADGLACDGVLLFAYPLHPAGKPEKLRDAHLARIAAPVLCFNGTRDTLCTRELMEAVVRKLPPTWQMHWVEGADHSFHVLKAAGRNDDDVMREVGDATLAWLTGTVGATHSMTPTV